METMKLRQLTDIEIEQLKMQGNLANDWHQITIGNNIDLATIRNNMFFGSVAIGNMNGNLLHDGALHLPEGIYNSMLSNCTIGDCCAIHNVRMLSGYSIGNNTMLFNIGEMVSRGEPQWLEPMNECGGRRILPYPGMTIADAYLWAKYRDHSNMVDQMEAMARHWLSTAEGSMGQVGDHTVVKNCQAIRNVAILSAKEAPSKIEDCVTLADGVVGFGCHLCYGCTATRFVLGENVKLEYGARLNDTVVGDNSTIARCEIGNNIIFPAHEQHHNNSFLIAATVMGQSNVAAGCTIGSNHNGRTADNELVAGRGFWPGLCTSLKHSSAFASYTLLAKGDYPAELSITLPFSLVSNNEAKNRLEVMPAYWWMYNMFALNRNITKFAKRDKRHFKRQHIVFTPFAPDTAEEIINGRMLLKYWVEQAYYQNEGKEPIEVLGYGLEKGKRKTIIAKWAKGYKAYEEMLIYYAMGALTEEGTTTSLPCPDFAHGQREREWVNLGGQLVPQSEIDQLIREIESGDMADLESLHKRYDQWWEQYPQWCCKHAYQVLCMLNEVTTIDESRWQQLLQRYATIRQYVADQVRITREKDNANPFRQMTYRNDAEMKAVIG